MLAACFLIPTGVACSNSFAEPTGSTRIDYGMPERLGREVAPVPGSFSARSVDRQYVDAALSAYLLAGVFFGSFY